MTLMFEFLMNRNQNHVHMKNVADICVVLIKKKLSFHYVLDVSCSVDIFQEVRIISTVLYSF